MGEKKVVIFGAGDKGKVAYKTLMSQGYTVLFYLDNKPSLWGRRLGNGLLVYNLEQYIELGLDVEIVIATQYRPQIDIEKQLQEHNITNYTVYDRMTLYDRGRLISYSQKEEMTDVILYHILKDEEKIFYIDVGSNDPVLNSVTKLLYDCKGARGINIEPQPHLAGLYRRERPEDITLCMGIGKQKGIMNLFVQEGGSTLKTENVVVNHCPSIEIEVDTLKSICDVYVEKKKISFLKVDVEGFEKEVLEGADFAKYRPEIIVVESVVPRENIYSYADWESILLDNHYRFILEYGLNRYYVAEECGNKYTKAFLEIEDIDSKYDIYHMYPRFWR